ncbi:unnamed protein product [Periconia digitata]|uniref:Uncharacterized protein n=1 Tax=Periconia digitata TaxID=1303443 RepID=A0A9W4U6H8_9PLEO|nr:unnamed protein product [Periconia digitata]
MVRFRYTLICLFYCRESISKPNRDTIRYMSISNTKKKPKTLLLLFYNSRIIREKTSRPLLASSSNDNKNSIESPCRHRRVTDPSDASKTNELIICHSHRKLTMSSPTSTFMPPRETKSQIHVYPCTSMIERTLPTSHERIYRIRNMRHGQTSTKLK